MSLRIEYSSQATKDLKEILRFIGNDNKAAAKKMLSSILYNINLLADNPELGKHVGFFETSGECRMLVIKQYLAIYTRDGESVEIIKILHDKEDYLRYLRVL